MERNFKTFSQPLAGRHIDLAMVPLDPRQNEDGFRTAVYFSQIADIRRLIPMHQWGNFAFTEAFLTKHPEFSDRLFPVTHTGQTFEF
jgi:hypothetical protein